MIPPILCDVLIAPDDSGARRHAGGQSRDGEQAPGRSIALAYKARTLGFCLVLSLAGCATHTQPDMDDSAGADDQAPQSDGAHGSHGGGGHMGGLWTEMARTALQTGMGFIHH
ncbi:hypothetical protein [Asaia bogorensis]|uniref:hypothetical protein n=1 Tax=Asaia bogorensis TaxID=91915 RepID=UPI001F11C352|nr:hypothetical protein [Asaia bogorensis]